jgi:hypothetical protein
MGQARLLLMSNHSSDMIVVTSRLAIAIVGYGLLLQYPSIVVKFY